MVSLPINVTGSKNILFPTSTSDAFSYSNISGYMLDNILTPGKGYWLKFFQPQSVVFTGMIMNSLVIPVTFGWNMIGSISTPVPVASIITEPSQIKSSSIYGFDQSYFIADTLKPGNSYWLKVNQSGKIILYENNGIR